jgi:hypothetical protein
MLLYEEAATVAMRLLGSDIQQGKSTELTNSVEMMDPWQTPLNKNDDAYPGIISYLFDANGRFRA